MKYVSIRKNKISVWLCFLASLCSAAFLGMSMSCIWVKSVWQLGFMVFTVTAIQIAQKYLLSSYEYILDPDDELLTYNRLTVVKTVGRKKTSLFTVPLSGMTEIIPYKKMKKIEKEYGKIGKKFNYCSDIRPKESYLLIFEDETELTIVRLQCDSAFASLLEARAGV